MNSNSYQRGEKLLCGGYSSYTPTGRSYFVKQGRFGNVPHYGDVVYFYTSNMGRVSHVGIVESVDRSNDVYTIYTIEGNTNAGAFERDGGNVARKKYEFMLSQVGGKNRINGFGTPDFSGETCGEHQFVEMAKSQLGYVEKASNRDLEDFKANPGDKNFTKYGKWYGLNPAQWCQMFVSWCAYKACEQAHEYMPGWIQQDDGSWKYRKADGEFARNEWQYINGRWYVFADDCKMIKGWFKQADGWYYLGEDGAMLSGQWFCENDKHYYLTQSGLMATNAYIRSERPFAQERYIYYWVNENGEWEPQWDTEYPYVESYEVVK